jgi:dolichyl-phosphate-mannose--protein O-mannosyl transferase
MTKLVTGRYRLLVPIANLIFSGFHLGWLVIISERVDLFAYHLWVAVALPVAIFLSSAFELISGRKSREITIIAYIFLISLAIYVVVLVSTETGGFKLSRVQEVLVYAACSVAMLILNWIYLRKSHATAQV